jgi:hypothetical protein
VIAPGFDMASFAPDFARARERFGAVASALGTVQTAHARGTKGPHGEELATDTAWFGPREASRVLVLISATHGVEGFCGSGCQVDFMQTGGPGRLPPDTAALLVHAINAHGFAWLRRTTEENCDLNRNFVDFAKPLPVNADYASLADAFVPPAADDAAFATADARLAAFKQAHGERRLAAAMVTGQYTHPSGLFHGGTAPTIARRTLERIVAEHALASRERVAVIDVHTGLGPYGHGEAICGHAPGTAGQARARAWYGDSLTEPLLGTSSSLPLTGLMQNGFAAMLGPDRFTFIALEYGTYPPAVIESALRREAAYTAAGGTFEAPEARPIKAALRRAFYPDQDDWRALVLFRARQVISQALAGLTA